jgi:flavin-binding protein dodecin
MRVAKVNQLIGSSSESFEDAARQVVARANRTLRGITGVEVVEKRIKIEDGRQVEYRVRLHLTFDMAPATELHW